MLQKAVRIESTIDIAMLPWYLPMRQALGNVLLQSGQPIEAERVFREDINKASQ